MSYQVSDKEKLQAEKALRWLEFCLKILKQSSDHLNLIYNPFKKNSSLPADRVFKYRAALRRYRDKVVDNFNNFKKVSFKCYVLLQPFTSDTQIEKLLKSFVMAIDDIEKQVNRFIDLFSDLKSPEFAKAVVSGIDNIKKEVVQLEQIIEDRMKNHIRNNILARNWVDTISQELQDKVERKIPLVIQLVQEREKQEEL